jgi:hypothetical protein
MTVYSGVNVHRKIDCTRQLLEDYLVLHHELESRIESQLF